jgi:hypothetical protein
MLAVKIAAAVAAWRQFTARTMSYGSPMLRASLAKQAENGQAPAFPQELLASVAVLVAPAGLNRCEGLTSVGEDSGCVCCRLIAPDDDVDVERIELDAAAHPAGTLGGYQGRPGGAG